MVNSIILILVIIFSVILSGFFSGAETGIYQLSRLRLRLGVEKKRLSFAILARSLTDSSSLLISILIGTNLSCYLATSIVTYLLLRHMGAEYTAELFATLITAPVLFVFAELLPKSIFFYRSDSLMPCIAPILLAFHKLFSWCGAVPLLKFVSRFFAGLTGSHIPSGTAITAMRSSHIKAIFADSREEGILSPVQSDIINRLVNISNVSMSSVMTPVSKVQTVDINSDSSTLLKILRKYAFTRLPVVDRYPANIVGFINIYETLSSPEAFTDLHNFIKPIRSVPASTIISDAINIMKDEGQKIILVTKAGHAGREKHIGIVTMKDLVEELLGELAEW